MAETRRYVSNKRMVQSIQLVIIRNICNNVDVQTTKNVFPKKNYKNVNMNIDGIPECKSYYQHFNWLQ
jgi:hypothetical protein